MLGFQPNGLADLADRLAVGLFMVLVIIFGVGAVVALYFFKGAL